MRDYGTLAAVLGIGGALALVAAIFFWFTASDDYEVPAVTIGTLKEAAIILHARTEECAAAHDLGKSCK